MSSRELPRIPLLAAGGLVLFSGSSQTSWGIRLGTCSKFSHVGIIAEVGRNDLLVASRRNTMILESDALKWPKSSWPFLFESTTLVDEPCEVTGRTIKGVQAHTLGVRLRGYAGRAWYLKPTDRWQLTGSESCQLTALLLDKIGVAYDPEGAVLAGTIFSKRWWMTRRAADRSTLFCVEYVADALLRSLRGRPDFPSGLLPGQLSPIGLVRWVKEHGLYESMYRLPTKGEIV